MSVQHPPNSAELPVPDPALVVLAGASGSGKSSWARARYATGEVVSSDALRAAVGAGEHDLAASVDAFAVLEQIVDARVRRGLLTVVDTLGLDPDRRLAWKTQARAANLPAVLVLFETPAELCRRRNSARDQPVPAPVMRAQFARFAAVTEAAGAEGWDAVIRISAAPEPASVASGPEPAPATPQPRNRLDVVLQVSRFRWGTSPVEWLTGVATAAEAAGFAGLALMDHLIQIPQVDRAWEPIPEPWVTLGLLACVTSRLRLGTLVSPVTLRAPGVLAKSAATLDVLSGGRAFLGVGAGWWEREHAGFGVRFPPARERLDQLERGLEMIRALWAPGTKGYSGSHLTLPETTCYPRPVRRIPLIVGGEGERRTLRIAARWGDACNVSSVPETLDRKIAVLRRHCADVGRDPKDVEITVLDLPVIGADRADVKRRVEQLRGRASAEAYTRRHPAGTVEAHIRRYTELADRGVGTVFVALPDLAGGEDVSRLEPLVRAMA